MLVEELFTLCASISGKPIIFKQVNSCIECTSYAKDSYGYTMLRIDGVKTLLHRWIYFQYNPTIDKSFIVRHTCDNRACCNPNHLIHGTHYDNMQDLKERSNYAIGDTHGNTRFTNTLIHKIVNDSSRPTELMRRYNISATSLRRLRKNYSHLKGKLL